MHSQENVKITLILINNSFTYFFFSPIFASSSTLVHICRIFFRVQPKLFYQSLLNTKSHHINLHKKILKGRSFDIFFFFNIETGQGQGDLN